VPPAHRRFWKKYRHAHQFRWAGGRAQNILCVPLRLVPRVEPIIVRLRSPRFRDLDPLDDPDIRRDVIERADVGAETEADIDDSEMDAAATPDPQALRQLEVDAGQRWQSGLQPAGARARRVREAGRRRRHSVRIPMQRLSRPLSEAALTQRPKLTDSAAAVCLWLFL
jgi:hypothetical protein